MPDKNQAQQELAAKMDRISEEAERQQQEYNRSLESMEPELLDSTVRFSLSVESTRTEADYVLEQLAELLPILRRFRRH